MQHTQSMRSEPRYLACIVNIVQRIYQTMDHYIEKLVDLTDPSANHLYSLSLEAARERLLSGSAEAVREIEGSFALVARAGKMVRLARSLDRPLRYFLAKRAEGPALIVADR